MSTSGGTPVPLADARQPQGGSWGDGGTDERVALQAVGDDDLAGAVDALVTMYGEHEGFNGVVLVETPELEYRVAIGVAGTDPVRPLEPDSIFELASLSKHYLATAVLYAAEHGAFTVDGVDLGIDTPITHFLPDRVTDGYPHANLVWGPTGEVPTIRHLLRHSSGLPLFPQSVYQSPIELTARELVQVINQQPLISRPGQAFLYNNAGFTVLEVVLENATGTSYPAYLEDQVLAPLGLADTGCEWTEAQWARRAAPQVDAGVRQVDYEAVLQLPPQRIGAACGASGVHASARDVAAFARALREGQIISSFEDMRVPGPDPSYGLGTMISSIPTAGGRTWIGHNGASRTRASLLSNPEEDETVVVLSNEDPYSNLRTITSSLTPASKAMNVNLLAVLDGQPPSLPPFVTHDPSAVAPFVGDYCALFERYEVRDAEPALGVTPADGTLVVRRHYQWALPFVSTPFAAPLVPLADPAFPSGLGFVPAGWARPYLTTIPPFDIDYVAFDPNVMDVRYETGAVASFPRFQWWMFWCW